MDLQIDNLNNTYQLTGILNKFNVYKFKKEFLNIFDQRNSVTINIENLVSIDRYGVNAIAQLYNEALAKSKKLNVIGLGQDNLFEHFKSDETAA